MTLRSTILIRVVFLICSLVLALSGSFYWVFTGHVQQGAQQAVEAAFSLLEDSLQRKQREIAREVERINVPLRTALDQIVLIRNKHRSLGAADDNAYLRAMLAKTGPLADQLIALADTLGTSGVRIALYDRQGKLLLLFLNDAPLYSTLGLYLPETVPGGLLVQRRRIMQGGGSIFQTMQSEDRFATGRMAGKTDILLLPPDQPVEIPASTLTGTAQVRFVRLDRMLALQYRVPVHGESNYAYFASTTEKETSGNNNGFIELALQVPPGDIQQIAALSRTQINTFVHGELACGTLQTYTRFAGDPSPLVKFSGFVSNPAVSRVVSRTVGGQTFYESQVSVGNDEGPVAAIAVLLSRQMEQQATLMLLVSISTAALMFGLLAVTAAIRLSRQVATPICRVADIMQRLSRGETEPVQDRITETGKVSIVEVRQMDQALEALLQANSETIALAEAIADGELEVQVTSRSDQDRMMHTLNQMVRQLSEHSRLTQQAIKDAETANQALSDSNCKLEALSNTDALTGIANRGQFDRTLAREYARHVRIGAELSLILLDVDFFKLYNDHYGHLQGDECLRRISSALAANTQRPSDLAARYGGEEFACILPETGRSGALQVAERIRLGIAGLAIPHAQSSVAAHVTASLGVVTALCRGAEPPELLLEQADRLLYQSKNTGRNRVTAVPLTCLDTMAGMPFVQFTWNDEFCSGNRLIDSQHQTLLNRANQLFEAFQTALPCQEVKGLVMALLDDLQLHFHDEEQILQEAGFPGLEQHVLEHARLLASRQTLVDACACDQLSPHEVCSFLIQDLVMQHLLNDDRQFFEFLQSKANT